MRFCFLLVLSSIVGVGRVRAQIDLVNRTSQRTDSSFIFIGVRNHLEITGGQGATGQLKARNAVVSLSDSPRLFIVEPDKPGPDTLQVIEKGRVVVTKVFISKWLTYLASRWGALTKYTATIPEVIANKRMTLFVRDCNCAAEWRIVGYRMTFVSNQPMNEIRINGAALPAEAIPVIQGLRPGDKIVFNEILVVCRTCRVRELPPFTITIAAP